MKRIFISYAKEDIEIAKRLCADLKSLGVDPWIDVDELLPGHNWELKIEEAIQSSSYFLALISDKAVNKRGYFQTELKKAATELKKIPLGQIFVIPVRLDKSAPIYRGFSEIHCVDLFPSYEEGLSKIALAIDRSEGRTNNQPRTIYPTPIEEQGDSIPSASLYRDDADTKSQSDRHRNHVGYPNWVEEAKQKNFTIFGEWEAKDPANRFRMRVTWDEGRNRVQGMLTKHGKASKHVGFEIGEIVCLAYPTKKVGVLRERAKRRFGLFGISIRSVWDEGIVDISTWPSQDIAIMTLGEEYHRIKTF